MALTVDEAIARVPQWANADDLKVSPLMAESQTVTSAWILVGNRLLYELLAQIQICSASTGNTSTLRTWLPGSLALRPKSFM